MASASVLAKSVRSSEFQVRPLTRSRRSSISDLKKAPRRAVRVSCGAISSRPTVSDGGVEIDESDVEKAIAEARLKRESRERFDLGLRHCVGSITVSVEQRGGQHPLSA